MNRLLTTTLSLLLMSGTTLAGPISSSMCHVKDLKALDKPAVDLLGHALGTFDCVEAIGAGIDKNIVFVYVSEHDYKAIAALKNAGKSADFSFDGTYAGKIVSYNGVRANYAALPAKRTGIETDGLKTTFTFIDVKNAQTKSIYKAFVEAGPLNLEDDSISVELTSPEDGIGELKITVLNQDITGKMIAVSNGILLANGERMASDQIEFSKHSAFVISNLLIEAKMAVNRGSSHKPGHYPQFWDYVYLDKDGKDPLFHCANVHSGEAYTKCYINQLRIK